MSEPKNEIVRVGNRDLETMPVAEAIEAYSPRFAEALPDNIPLQRFKRTVITALNTNPDLRTADRRSLFNACVKCAHDGLYPDGREAALVVFKNTVQYLPMIAGIRKRMRNSGEVTSAEARIVYENDEFHYQLGESPQIVHEPAGLDQEPGRAVGAYAIIKLRNGEIIREIMRLAEIERVRAFSRTGNSPGSPWQTSWSEMARKTVLRRAYKAAPSDSEIDRLLSRDEEADETAQIVHLETPPPPPPTREQFMTTTPRPAEITAGEEPKEPDEEPDEKPFNLINLDSEVMEYETHDMAANDFLMLLSDAAAAGKTRLEGVWIDNEPFMQTLRNDPQLHPLAVSLDETYTGMLAKFAPKSAPVTSSRPTETTAGGGNLSEPEPRRRGRPPKVAAQPPQEPSPPAWVTENPGENEPSPSEKKGDGASPEPHSGAPQDTNLDTEDAPIEDAASQPAPAPSVQLLVDYDAAGNLGQYYDRVRSKISHMRQAGSQPSEFKRFRIINDIGLRRMQEELRSFWPAIDKMLNAGEQGI